MPPTKTKTDYRKFFFSFGVELSTGSQLQGDCPFCSREGHFFVNPHTGQYDCKLCGESGNAWSFIRNYHAICLSSTTKTDYQSLSEDRGIKPVTLEHLQLALNPLTGRWLIPCNNLDGKLTNCYHAAPREHGGFNLLSTPSPCVQQLYLGDRIKSQDTVWVAEGHWDGMAWLEVLASLAQTSNGIKLKGRPNFTDPTRLLHTNAIVALPGATNFNKGWAKVFADKDVVLMHDNDPTRVLCPTCKGTEGYEPREHFADQPCPKCGSMETTGQLINPGRQGIERITKIFSESKHQPRSLQNISWRSDDPKDVRDLLFI